MEFRILGPLEVLHEERNVALGGSRERALLALLLLSANRVVSTERLAEDLWAGRPPEAATKALKVYVSRLRKALRESGGDEILVTQPPGYVAQLDPDALDAARFESLLAQGREEAAKGDHPMAAATLREALALWRGPALADVADAPFARAEAARLEEARLAALEERVEADLADGRHSELVGELGALIRAHPLRERLWAQRMLALYRSGRQAEALRAYQELRRLLADDLGLEPAEALRRLEAAVLRHDPELDWTGRSRAASAPPPLPALLTEMGRIFVGRQREFEQLEQLWKKAAAGELHLALVAGEPGVGKTRLAAELAARVHAQQAIVLAGRCDEDLGVPYQPFVEALRQFVDHAPTEHLRGRLGRYGGELVRLLPELAERLPGLPPPLKSDPETERYRLFAAMAAWLGAISADVPLLLVLDDLQWAAKPTLLLLRHIVRSPELAQILVLGTYRDTELGHDRALVEVLADLRRQGGVERFSLTGLDSSGVTAFIEQAAGHPFDGEDLLLARAIHQETEGNPFFVREVLRHLTETEAVERRQGRWATRLPVEELGIPEGVREVVGRRLSRLSEEANQTLRLAAVAGAEFELPMVQAAGRLDEDALLSSVEEATEARLISETRDAGRYRFAHALVRDTLYGELSGPRRVTLHRRVAEGIEGVYAARLDDHLPALAHHWARASAPAAETGKAVEYATRAGDRALAQLAHDEAVTYYRSAVDLLETASVVSTDARRVELLISLGEAQRRAGDPEHRQTLLGAAALATRTGDTGALARAALANYRGIHSSSRGVDAQRTAVLEQALRALPQTDSIVRARLLATLASELFCSPEHARRYRIAEEALAMARRLGDPSTLARVLVTRLPALIWTADRTREMAEFATLAGRIGDPALVFWAKALGGMTSLTVGDVRAFTLDIDEAVRLADELGQPTMRWIATLAQAAACRLSGRLDDAERVARHAMEIGEAAGAPDARHVYEHSSLFWVRYDQGRLTELVEACERHASGPSPPSQSVVNLGLAYAELGRLDEARAVLDRLAADDFALINGGMSRIIELTVATEVCAAVADRPRAETLHRLLAPHRGLIAHRGSASTGAVDHHLALLETTLDRFADADASFASAAAFHEPLGAPAWLARARLEWARMLLSRRQPGDAQRAREFLGQALATARELGLGNVERRASALLS